VGEKCRVEFWPSGSLYWRGTRSSAYRRAHENLEESGFQCAIETNGTLPIKAELDWITVSPKTSQKLEVFAGDELKLVYPQQHIKPELFETLDFRHFFLQPKDDENFNENLSKSIEYCLKHPRWRLSVQTHKYIGID
jgi:organic radical activating enzyme